VPPGPELTSDRLLLRRWRDEDREPFAAMNADPEVMRHFESPLTRRQSDALIDQVEAGFEADGFGFWAVQTHAGAFIGCVGIARSTADAHFTPAVEMAWRLGRRFWGQGYATEAAARSLDFAFGPAALDEVVAFTAATNERSRALMARLGMQRDPAEDFEHPRVAPGHPLREHVLFRMPAASWRARRSTPR
jgi:ribosomal-protein-alanine N-acetyltransferase